MKRYITIACITITACVALYVAVWPRSTESGKLPAKTVKHAVIAEIEAKPEEMLPILLPADNCAPEPTVISESEPAEAKASTTEEKTEPTPSSKPITEPALTSDEPSSEPKQGTIAIVYGQRCMWIPGFGWVKDEGGGAQGTSVGSPDDELTGNKVGKMGGGITVDGEGDISKIAGIMGADDTPPSEKSTPAPGSKAVIDGKPSVWIPGFGWIEDNGGGNGGTVAEDMYENGNKIGIMD